MMWRLRSQPYFWYSVWFGSLFFLFILLVVGLVAGSEGNSFIARSVRENLGGGLTEQMIRELGPLISNDLVTGGMIAFLSSMVSISTIYIFKIPAIRETSIRVIAFGYYENFLKKVVSFAASEHECYRVCVILPQFELVSQPDLYWKGMRQHLKRLGFEVKPVTSDQAFFRNTYLVMKKSSPELPIFVDVPTTTRTLQEILELEADMPVGKSKNTKWFRHRFNELRDAFGDALRSYYPEQSLRSFVILAPTSEQDFEASLTTLVSELEDEIKRLGRVSPSDPSSVDV